MEPTSQQLNEFMKRKRFVRFELVDIWDYAQNPILIGGIYPWRYLGLAYDIHGDRRVIISYFGNANFSAASEREQLQFRMPTVPTKQDEILAALHERGLIK